MDGINEISLKLKLTRQMYTRVHNDWSHERISSQYLQYNNLFMNLWFSHFPRVRILLEDKDDEVLLGGHEDLVTGGLEPQEGQVVGRVEVSHYRLGLWCSLFVCLFFWGVHLLHQVGNGVPVLHGGGVVQVTLDGESLVIENHHTDNIRRILTINQTLFTKCITCSAFTVILLMMSDISSLHSTMLLLDTVVLGARDIRLLELLFLEAILSSSPSASQR